MDADFREECMDNRNKDNDGNGNATLLPFTRYSAGRNDDIGCEYDASRSCYMLGKYGKDIDTCNLPVNPRAIACTANTVVMSILGRRYAASR